MKKHLLFVVLFIISLGSYAQCPLSVGITSLPDISTVEACKGTPVLLTASPSAGAVTPTYIWIINGDTSFTAGTDTTINAYDQTVELIMQTTTGCLPASTDTVSTTIQILTVIITPAVAILDSDCDGTTADIQITSSGGTSPYSYDLVGIGTSTTGLYPSVPTGNYTLHITDNQGCMDTDIVIVTPVPTIITSTPFPRIECNQPTGDVVITSTSTGATTSYSYDLVGIGTSSTGSYSNVPQGSYILYTTGDDGCKDTNQVTITPFTCVDPVPFDAITPNGDGINDTWIISGIQFYPDNEVFIFDRWGQRVYHKNDYDNIDGWEAKYLGVNEPVSTYYYILKIYLEQSDDIVMKGAISVLR